MVFLGAAIAIAGAQVITYPLLVAFLRRYKSWDPLGDSLLMLGGFALTGLAAWMHWDEILLLVATHHLGMIAPAAIARPLAAGENICNPAAVWLPVSACPVCFFVSEMPESQMFLPLWRTGLAARHRLLGQKILRASREMHTRPCVSGAAEGCGRDRRGPES